SVVVANFRRFTPLLSQTPWLFKISPPWQLSYFDRLFFDAQLAPGTPFTAPFDEHGPARPVGSWLPFFYNDKKRTFFVLPLIESSSASAGREVYSMRQNYTYA